MAVQVKEAVTPATEEVVAHLLDGRETFGYFGYLVDIDESHAVGHIKSDRIAIVNPFGLSRDDRPPLARSPERLEALPDLALAALLGPLRVDGRNVAVVLAGYNLGNRSPG